MKTIWKFELEITDLQAVEMPIDAEILTVQTQNENPCIWVLVDPEKPSKMRLIRIIGTGHEKDKIECKYIGTYQLENSALVFHVFDEGYQL